MDEPEPSSASSHDRKPAPGGGVDKSQKPAEAVSYSMSPGLAAFLGAQQIALAFSSYQSGKLYLVSQSFDGGLLVHERFFHKAMGIGVPDRDTLLLATRFQILTFRNVLKPDQRINGLYGACYVPRRIAVTGELDAHDLGLLDDGRVVFVNTRYNCLATLSERHSFTPLWMPPFISKLVAEDRCHLNGLAMADGEPRYVTAASRSDTVDGWRDRRSDGGIVIDVRSGEIVLDGLSMPHSPRLYRERLWLLNSGTGELGWVEPGTDGGKGRFHALAFCPGFVRGLAFHGNYAFVGLSRPRYQRFEGLALDQRLAETDSAAWTGVQVIDLGTGTCVHWFRLDGPIAELYDVNVIPGVVRPMMLGFATNEILGLITHDEMETSDQNREIARRTGDS